MRLAWGRLVLLPVLVLAAAACGGDPAPPTAAERTYGAAVATADAVPAPAVAAEPARYASRPVTIDGRVARVVANGCGLILRANGASVRVDAPTAPDGCAWRFPAGTDGIAVAAGTLRTTGDTLRLSASGVQVTPVQPAGAKSAP
jgi:hypothetical protein